jgi:hypothetical protein
MRDLEARWRKNLKPHKRERVQHSFVRIGADGVPEHWDAERSKKLIADDFVNELARLGTEWLDERFHCALQALFDHEIVEEKDERFRWTNKKGSVARQIADRERARERVYVRQVQALVDSGKSELAACTQVVVETGYPGQSFEHAISKLRMSYRRSRQQSNDR